MRVFYLIDALVPGGAERSLAALVPEYRRRGIDLHVGYLYDKPGLQAEITEGGASLHHLGGRDGRLSWLRRTRVTLARIRPDILHTTLFESNILGRLAADRSRTTIVCSLVNKTYGSEQLDDPRLKRWKVHRARVADIVTARRVARFHAVTDEIASYMSERLFVPRSRIDVIPRGRNPDDVGMRTSERRARVRVELDIAAEVPLVLAVARLDRQKGVDLLVAAWPEVLARCPAARLIVAGRRGNNAALIDDLVERAGVGDSVTFLGERNDVPDLLCGSDVFVLPSRWEGFPGVLLEAMALEIPVVASSLPSVMEIVAEGAWARLVDPHDASALGGRIAGLLTNPPPTHEARRRFLERFTSERAADQLLAFYERAMAVAEPRS